MVGEREQDGVKPSEPRRELVKLGDALALASASSFVAAVIYLHGDRQRSA